MLEEKDLQAIAELLTAMEDRLDKKMDGKRKRLNDMEAMDARISALETEVIILKMAVRTITADIAELKKAQ